MLHCVIRRGVLFLATAVACALMMAIALCTLDSHGTTGISSAAEQKRLDDSPLFGFRQGKKLEFIDRTGKIVIPPQFAEVTRFSEQLAAVADASYKSGYIDRCGQFVIPAQFSDAEPFSEG